MPIANEGSAYQSVYQVVEDVCSGESLPIGLNGTLFGAIDGLRQMDAPKSDICLAERISIAMHKLEWAVRSGDVAAQAALRVELGVLGSSWRDTPLCAH